MSEMCDKCGRGVGSVGVGGWSQPWRFGWELCASCAGVLVACPIVCPASGKWARDGLGVSSHVVGVDGRRDSVARGSLGVGACVACGVCLPGGRVRGVTFLLHGGKNTGKTAGRLGAAVSVRLRRAVMS